MASNDALNALRVFGRELTAKFRTLGDAQPEDQLKAPVDRLLRSLGEVLGLPVVANTESRVDNIGRPDVAVSVRGLLSGYVELKAPGTGADVRRFKGRNLDQWKKFKALPNLIYTDGTDWILYRDGSAALRVRLPGDVTEDEGAEVGEADAASLRRLLQDFYAWQPIVPSGPKKLAELLAPLCRLVRQDVLAALDVDGSAMRLLRDEWRSYLFPDADNDQFADAYAQTLTYALLLARLSSTNLGQRERERERAHGACQQHAA